VLRVGDGLFCGAGCSRLRTLIMAVAMLDAGIGFFAGYACRAQCGSLPCQAKLASSSKPFKLSVVVHSASLGGLEGAGLVENKRPYVGLSVGDRSKETELGDWCKEKGQWCFREIITVLVEHTDEISLFVNSSTRYNLYVASVSLTSERLGEICFPVNAVLPWFRAEDRDADGVVYATPVRSFEIVQDGRFTGKVYLSFETKSPPPAQKLKGDAECCGGFGGEEGRTRQPIDDCSTTASSSRQTDRGLPGNTVSSVPRSFAESVDSSFPLVPDTGTQSWRNA